MQVCIWCAGRCARAGDSWGTLSLVPPPTFLALLNLHSVHPTSSANQLLQIWVMGLFFFARLGEKYICVVIFVRECENEKEVELNEKVGFISLC